MIRWINVDGVDFSYEFEDLLGMCPRNHCAVHWMLLLLPRSQIFENHKIIRQNGTPSK